MNVILKNESIEFEFCDSCPICDSKLSSVLYENLKDGVFNFPSISKMYNCNVCSSAFLNPRINEKSIHHAYSKYYTHNDIESIKGQTVLTKTWKKILLSYLDFKFNTKSKNFYFNLGLAIYLIPRVKRVLDRDFRNLRKDVSLNILDIGCGDGTFLALAKNAGHTVLGVDPDHIAVLNARSKNLDVIHGDIYSIDKPNYFDAIFLSHVIEHVHYPQDVISEAYRLLKPNGYIWIDTPNIESYGNKLFSRYWRGLEPPRHLSIFNWNSLHDLLEQKGFKRFKRYPYLYNFYTLGKKSNEIKFNLEKKRHLNSINLLFMSCFIFVKLLFNHRRSEFVTLKAYK